MPVSDTTFERLKERGLAACHAGSYAEVGLFVVPAGVRRRAGNPRTGQPR
jgi:hypothetical protein